MIRAAGAAAAACAALAVAAPAAGAQILAPEDAAELAQSLAEATDEQGVCYGWQVTIDDENGSITEDVGSSQGPGARLDRTSAACPRYVELVAGVDYTSEIAEAEDSASYAIESNLGRPPTDDELVELGYAPDRLLGEDDDEALTSAVGALPLLVADHGEAKAVPFEPGDLPPEQQGRPTGSTGNDFVRENGALLGLCALMLVGGAGWLLLSLFRRPSET